jgi:atypical dual specificity phosphatase
LRCRFSLFIVFFSSQDAAENETELARHQIGAILNVAFGREAFPGRFEYLNCPILDEPGQSLSAEPFRRALQFLHECHDKKMRVLVHCNAGISRSCSVCVAFLMKQAHLSYDEALALVRKTRPAARPNAGFEEQLRKM